MRKSSKRVIRPPSTLIAPAQHDDLMLAPRLHLQMLLEGQHSADYLHSVAGVLNIAAALAQLHGHAQAQTQYSAAQAIMRALIDANRGPTTREGAHLVAAFNAANALLRRQTTHHLGRAITYVDRMIAAGQAGAVAPETADPQGVPR